MAECIGLHVLVSRDDADKDEFIFEYIAQLDPLSWWSIRTWFRHSILELDFLYTQGSLLGPS